MLFRLLCLAVALAASFTAAEAAPSSLIEPRLHLAPSSGAPTVAVTLDACGGGGDARIVGVLIDNRIPATIFMTARWIRRNGALAAKIKAHPELFEIENHGARHVPAVDRPASVYGIRAAGSAAAVKAEVAGGATAVAALTGGRPHWFRGATARYSPTSLTLIKAMGYRVAGYSIAADGGGRLSAAATARRIALARDGDVILAHLNRPGGGAGAGVVKGLLALKARGYRFVKLDSARTR